MTSLESISANALKLKPVQVLGWVLMAPFLLIGMLLRLLWLAPAFLIAAAVEGWKLADAAYERWRGRVPGTKP